ncbi:hypothetical protein EVAR_66620_1 [Eumeta japonica]|uniref:Uncharacterized protein n=1 Tax=Eumeta variegata TaxID=151549 RepID=A0A4C2A8S3_EUMVA|nr:hypothetical protein EVAR_66620_1 [Eumeta japonica]
MVNPFASGGLKGRRTGQSPEASLLQGPRATTQVEIAKCIKLRKRRFDDKQIVSQEPARPRPRGVIFAEAFRGLSSRLPFGDLPAKKKKQIR